MGREEKANELVGYLLGGLSKGYTPPFIFVYGRTGSGKSSTVRTVCANLTSHLSYSVVNLRNANTLYAAAIFIVEELGGEVDYARGRRISVQDIIDDLTECIKKRSDGRLFVLVLDEFDAVFSEPRGNPSNFVYKMTQMLDTLAREHYPVTVIAIMNDFLASSELDERIKSRLGASPEIFFEPYTKSELVAILENKAAAAFISKESVKPDILEYISEQVSLEHGDARRAIDLLRVAAEVAGEKGSPEVLREHVDIAMNIVYSDKVAAAMKRASYHTRIACGALVRLSYLLQEGQGTWFSTSTLYSQYRNKVIGKIPPVQYRRFSDILGELENLGLATSRTGTGSRGYGRQYKLAVPAECVGSTGPFANWWKELTAAKAHFQKEIETCREMALDATGGERKCYLSAMETHKNKWDGFVGLD